MCFPYPITLSIPYLFGNDKLTRYMGNSKLVTTIVSTFTAYYVHLWSTFFPDQPLTAPLPSFDGRAVCYPSVENLRDYMSWRQVDCELFISFGCV